MVVNVWGVVVVGCWYFGLLGVRGLGLLGGWGGCWQGFWARGSVFVVDLGLLRDGSIRLVVGGLPPVGHWLVVVGLLRCWLVGLMSVIVGASLKFSPAFTTKCGGESVVLLMSPFTINFISLVPCDVVFNLA